MENVIPQNRADMRKIEKLLDAPAIDMMQPISAPSPGRGFGGAECRGKK